MCLIRCLFKQEHLLICGDFADTLQRNWCNFVRFYIIKPEATSGISYDFACCLMHIWERKTSLHALQNHVIS